MRVKRTTATEWKGKLAGELARTHIDRLTDRPTDRLTDGQTNRQTDKNLTTTINRNDSAYYA